MLVLVLIWAIGANWLAYNKGYYHLSLQKKITPFITHLQLIISFALYLSISFLLTPLLAIILSLILKRVDPELVPLSKSVITGLYFGVMTFLLFVLLYFFYRWGRPICRQIWKNKLHFPSRSLFYDFGIGVLTWLISFPVVSVINDLIDRILKALYNFEPYEQNAVKFVKVSLGSPISITFAFLSVVVMAPLIEEFLFRGVLQTYLKKRLGVAAAILVSALCFALFHFSPNHSLGNIPLITSLFILGGFLGFLYERQGSLWAPIGLHIVFNTVSAMRIIFLPEAI